MRKCGNCVNRYESSFIGTVMCNGYEQCETEEDEILRAKTCEDYKDKGITVLEQEKMAKEQEDLDYRPRYF